MLLPHFSDFRKRGFVIAELFRLVGSLQAQDCAREGVAGNPLSDNKFGKSVIIREFAVK